MISSWKVSKFKSIYDPTTLKFAPLTLFSGINNSGKSTVIQSILLTSQTLGSQMRNRAVSLNGKLVRLGTFDDIVSNGHEQEAITIGFRLTDVASTEIRGSAGANRSAFIYHFGRGTDITHIESEFTFSARSTNERREIVQLQPVLEGSSLSLGYRSEDGSLREAGEFAFLRRSESPDDTMKRLKLFGRGDSPLLGFEVTRTPHDPMPAYLPYAAKGTIIGAYLEHFVPKAILTRFDHVEEESKQIVRAFLNRQDASSRTFSSDDTFTMLPDSFKDIFYRTSEETIRNISAAEFVLQRVRAAFDLFRASFTPTNYWDFVSQLYMSSARSGLLQKIAEHTDTLENLARAGRQPEYHTRYENLPARFNFASEYIDGYFDLNVKYLAPLRDEPKPVYPLVASIDPTDVGLHGEHTAAVLELNRSEIVSYIPSTSFSLDSVREEPIKATLLDAVLDWMKYMGVVTRIDTHDLGNRGHELRVATGTQGNLRYLTHVGVGVSQVLPIVVLCLLAPQGSVLIFEQPELHLHPRVQSRLADFFLSMTFLGKQCIVETHSEHLINRLRYRTASAPADEISRRVMMYFVEAEDGKSRYQPVLIGPYGTINNWPKGFFDESENEASAILKAGMAKRRSEAGKR